MRVKQIKWSPAVTTGAIIVLVAMALGIVSLLLLKPQVGSVFSAVTKGLGSSGASSPVITPNGAASSNPVVTSNGQANSGSSTSLPNQTSERLIIRNATLALTAPDVEKTLGEIRALAIGQNGLVAQSSTTVRDDKIYANITLQIPAMVFDETMNQLRRLSGVKVESENTTSQDVTEEYVDLKAQIGNLKASETELVRLLTKTNNVAEIMAVQEKLGGVRGQIESKIGRQNYLEKKAALSTLTISLAPPPPVAPKPEPPAAPKGWDALKALDSAWEGSVRGLQLLFTVGVTLAAWGIWIVPLAGVGWFGGSRLRRRHRRTFSDLG